MTRRDTVRPWSRITAAEFSPSSPIIHFASEEILGYVSSEYLHRQARVGLKFIARKKVWKILHIGENEAVYVLPFKKTSISTLMSTLSDATLTEAQARDISHACSEMTRPGDHLDLGTVLEGKNHRDTLQMRRIISEIEESRLKGYPIPHEKQIVLEVFKNYLVVHTLLGSTANTALGLLLDSILTEQDLVNDVATDSLRILLKTSSPLAQEDVQAIVDDSFYLSRKSIEEACNSVVEARFPKLSYAPRQPQVDRPEKESSKISKKLWSILGSSSIAAFYDAISRRELKIRMLLSRLSPSPLARAMIQSHERHAKDEAQGLFEESALPLERTIDGIKVSLLCFECSTLQPIVSISSMGARPSCFRCGSDLLVPAGPELGLQGILVRRIASGNLNAQEKDALTAARRKADVVLSYGRLGVIALTVPGIGAQTASRILARMHSDLPSLYSELLEAKASYLATRGYWN